MKKFLILFFTINILITPVLALGFDTSIDEEIRKKYDPSKIEEDASLPPLPSSLNIQTNNYNVPISNSITQKSAVQKTSVQNNPSTFIQPVPKSFDGSHAILKAGTKITAKLTNSISDRSRKGSKVTFISKYPVSTTYFTIPSGTIFQGEIIDSHKPQLSGNGGLLVINVNAMILNNSIQPINASITKAHYKKIFFNNIKGKRRYMESVARSAKPGCHFLSKMIKVSSHQAGDSSTLILAPFSFASGIIVFGARTIASPVLGLFSKGESLCIPVGSNFEIKLLQDVVIYN